LFNLNVRSRLPIIENKEKIYAQIPEAKGFFLLIARRYHPVKPRVNHRRQY